MTDYPATLTELQSVKPDFHVTYILYMYIRIHSKGTAYRENKLHRKDLLNVWKYVHVHYIQQYIPLFPLCPDGGDGKPPTDLLVS